MGEHLRHLIQHARMPISVPPQPACRAWSTARCTTTSPRDARRAPTQFVCHRLGVQVIGGCCGTTPEHLAAVVERRRDLAGETDAHEPSVTSIYSLVPFHQDTSFMIDRRAHECERLEEVPRGPCLEGDLDRCVQMGRDQVKEGATSSTSASTTSAATAPATWTSWPALRHAGQRRLVLDSTEPQVMEAGLQWLGGRAILNSANLEDGEAEGRRLDRVFTLAREYGAAVICLLIDEEGQARDVEWKMGRPPHRDLVEDRYGLETSEDLIFWTPSPSRLHRRRRPAPRRHRDHGGHPAASRRRSPASPPLGVSPTSFGLARGPPRPEQRVPPRGVEAGLDSASSTRPASCRSTRSPTSSAR